MMLLAIETASPDVSVALHDGTQVIASQSLSIGSRHAEALLPAINHLLDQCGRSLTELTHLAVDRGPGLFTGLRVGLATARALAFALDVPLVGVSSLEAIAFDGARNGETVIAVLDARRKEVYAAAYSVTDGVPSQLLAPFVASPVDAAAQLAAAHLDAAVLLGDGANAGDGVLHSLGRTGSQLRPGASAVASLAAGAVGRDVATLDPFELFYLRAPDAEITWNNRHGPAPR
jgi:tRNA threonylcarbamoyladenosine biosynthesis protein TsaB